MTMTNNKLILDGDAIVCENTDKYTVRVGNGSGLIVNCSAYKINEQGDIVDIQRLLCLNLVFFLLGFATCLFMVNMELILKEGNYNDSEK